MNRKKDYDMSMMGKAMTALALRLVVAGYIIYLAVKILTGAAKGEGPIPLWGTWLICAVFTVCAVAFCVFTVKQYIKTRKAAELPETPQKGNGGDAGHGGNETDGPEK